MTEDEMVGWHHRLNGCEFEQAPGVGDGQGSLVCCSPWDCKESDMTERPSHTVFFVTTYYIYFIGVVCSVTKCKEMHMN